MLFFKRFKERRLKNKIEQGKQYPDSVRRFYLFEALSLSAVIGSLSFLLFGYVMSSGFSPSMWAPLTFYLSGGFGVASFVTSTALINQNLKKGYDIQKPPLGTKNLTKRSLRSYKSLEEKLKAEQSKINRARLSHKDWIAELLNTDTNRFLDSHGNLSEDFDFLPKEDKMDLIDAVRMVSDIKKEINQNYQTLLNIKQLKAEKGNIEQENQQQVVTQTADRKSKNTSSQKNKRRK